MKKIFALVVLAFAAISASAQVYVGGSLGFTRDASVNQTTFTLAPEVGYSFNEKWTLGGVLDYTYKYNRGIDSNKFSLSPYARYTYARVANDQLSFFVDGGFGIGIVERKGDDSGTLFNIGFKPGLAYSFNDHCSIVAHVGFFGYEAASDNAEAYGYHNKFSFDFSSMNLNFGFYYTF